MVDGLGEGVPCALCLLHVEGLVNCLGAPDVHDPGHQLCLQVSLVNLKQMTWEVQS